MNVEVFNSDDPNHHRMGKDLLYSCPSEPTFAKTEASSPEIISPPVTISPPVKQSLHKLLGLLKKISIFRAGKHTPPSIVNYYIIENPTIENNNISNINAMKILGPIINFGTIQENNFYGKNEQQSNEQEGKEEAEDVEDVDHTEVVEVVGADESLSIDNYIAEKDNIQLTKNWLHLMIDKFDKPKEKLIFPRALSEGGVFTRELPHKIYEKEFGHIAKSSYRDWMMTPLRYKQEEIDKIIEQYLQYLAQFRK